MAALKLFGPAVTGHRFVLRCVKTVFWLWTLGVLGYTNKGMSLGDLVPFSRPRFWISYFPHSRKLKHHCRPPQSLASPSISYSARFRAEFQCTEVSCHPMSFRSLFHASISPLCFPGFSQIHPDHSTLPFIYLELTILTECINIQAHTYVPRNSPKLHSQWIKWISADLTRCHLFPVGPEHYSVRCLLVLQNEIFQAHFQPFKRCSPLLPYQREPLARLSHFRSSSGRKGHNGFCDAHQTRRAQSQSTFPPSSVVYYPKSVLTLAHP